MFGKHELHCGLSLNEIIKLDPSSLEFFNIPISLGRRRRILHVRRLPYLFGSVFLDSQAATTFSFSIFLLFKVFSLLGSFICFNSLRRKNILFLLLCRWSILLSILFLQVLWGVISCRSSAINRISRLCRIGSAILIFSNLLFKGLSSILSSQAELSLWSNFKIYSWIF